MYNRGKWISDRETASALNNIMLASVGKVNEECSDAFELAYRSWISNTKNNTIKGLELFPNAVFSHGTTESFDKFYTRHKRRNVKVFAGEYSYHQYASDCTVINNVNKIGPNDCVIISIPFADSGTEYKYHEIMRECTLLDVPVLVDCCWFGMCSGIDFDFTYPCIEDVVFSLSKTFPVNKLRIGCRFSKQYTDGLSVYKEHQYTNFFLQHIAIGLFKNFDSDFMYNKYRSAQLEVCDNLNVTPSPVVNLAWGNAPKWEYLNRGGPFNRLCISDQLTEHKYTVRTAPEDADRRVLI